MDNFKVMDISV